MSLRYAHLFDHTVRTEYERALDLANSHIGSLPTTAGQLPITDVTGPGLEGRARDQVRAGPVATACVLPHKAHARMRISPEHCPSFHTDSTHLGVLAAQRIDVQELATDAEKCGWIEEADRHRKLATRLDALIAQSESA